MMLGSHLCRPLQGSFAARSTTTKTLREHLAAQDSLRPKKLHYTAASSASCLRSRRMRGRGTEMQTRGELLAPRASGSWIKYCL